MRSEARGTFIGSFLCSKFIYWLAERGGGHFTLMAYFAKCHVSLGVASQHTHVGALIGHVIIAILWHSTHEDKGKRHLF